jgi:hypothetical protein
MNIRKIIEEEVNNIKCPIIKVNSDIINFIRKFKTSEELLRSGGIDIDLLDNLAFGFTENTIKTLHPKDLKIEWKEDFENVKFEIKKSGLSPKQWASKINLSEPIDVDYKTIKNKTGFYIQDGHHRFTAAKILNKPLNINLTIKNNPIIILGSDLSYDDFHRCIFNQIKQINEDYSKLDKNNIYKILEEFKIEDNHIDHYYGQDNYEAILYKKNDNIKLAKVNYVIYNSIITISIIESYVKGMGYGKILMIYLSKKYGYENLKRSALTKSGVKMRKELDNLFNFNYDDYIKSLNKLIDNEEIDKIKNKYIKGFLQDLIENGNYAWNYANDIKKLVEPYDLDDIAEISEYVKDSQHSNGYSTQEPPQHVIDLLNQLIK